MYSTDVNAESKLSGQPSIEPRHADMCLLSRDGGSADSGADAAGDAPSDNPARPSDAPCGPQSSPKPSTAAGRVSMPEVVAMDPHLSCFAKSIFLVLSFSAAQVAAHGEAFALSVRQILAALGNMSENCFYRHRKQLIDRGLIEADQPEMFGHCVYRILSGEECYGDLTDPEMTLSRALANADAWVAARAEGDPDGPRIALAVQPSSPSEPEKLVTMPAGVVSDYAKPTGSAREIPAPPLPAAARPAGRVGFDAYDDDVRDLMSRAVSDEPDMDSVRYRYVRLIDRGWRPEHILMAYERYKEDYLSTHSTPAQAMHLANFLSRNNGVGFWAHSALRAAGLMPGSLAAGPATPARQAPPAAADPTISEVRAYISERNLRVDAAEFFSYYDALGWRNSHGVPIRNWRSLADSWSNRAEQRAARDMPRVPERADVAAYAKQRKLKVDVDEVMSYWGARGWRFANGRPVQDWGAAVDYYAKLEAKRAAERPKRAGGSAAAGGFSSYLDRQRARAAAEGIEMSDEDLLRPGKLDSAIMYKNASPEVRRDIDETRELARQREEATRREMPELFARINGEGWQGGERPC